MNALQEIAVGADEGSQDAILMSFYHQKYRRSILWRKSLFENNEVFRH
jgi:hypothetical protein